MPLPMVHLSVAVSLSAKAGYFAPADFLLGSIAPDAIHMRPHANEADKQHVHLMDLDISHAEMLQLFCSKYGLEAFPKLGFSAGYLTHLLTDFLWKQVVIDPFRQKLPAGLSEKEVRSIYYRDTDHVDFDLYRQMPWRPQA
jgi:hypothetical protein